jgi:hypothetical protein
MWSLPNGSGEQPPAKEQVKGIAPLIPTFINTIGHELKGSAVSTSRLLFTRERS